MAIPPVPFWWKVTTSNPRSSKVFLQRNAPGVVVPNMDKATGIPSGFKELPSNPSTIPQIAPAAFSRMRFVTKFNP
jgi:hypothetical protein